jgi:transcription initiation factor TFIID subunit TAF12
MLGKQNAFGGSAMSLGKEALSRQRSYSAAASIGSELSNGGGGGSATPLEQQKQTKKVQKQQQQQQKQKQQVPSAQNSLNTADDPLHVVNAGLASLALQRATGGDALGSSGGTKQPKKKEQQSPVVEHRLPAPARATSRNGSRNSGFFSKWF